MYPAKEGVLGDMKLLCSLPGADLFSFPPFFQIEEIFRHRFPWPSKLYAPQLRGGDTLHLTLADILPLGLRHIK